MPGGCALRPVRRAHVPGGEAYIVRSKSLTLKTDENSTLAWHTDKMRVKTCNKLWKFKQKEIQVIYYRTYFYMGCDPTSSDIMTHNRQNED